MSDHCASLLIRSCCSLERHGSSTIVNAAARHQRLGGSLSPRRGMRAERAARLSPPRGCIGSHPQTLMTGGERTDGPTLGETHKLPSARLSPAPVPTSNRLTLLD